MSSVAVSESRGEERSAEGAVPAELKRICAHELSVTLPGFGGDILQRLSLSVRAGEHVAIMGLSGTGKTTLLHALAGRIPLSGGSVSRVGRVATIYQDLRLIPSIRVLDQVLHGGLQEATSLAPLTGFDEKLVERAQGLVSRVGLSLRAHHRVFQLSGGERQRVAVARVLMCEPTILLADEPVSALDEAHARDLLSLLTDLARERGLAVISVLHDGWLAHHYCDRVFELRSGMLHEVERERHPAEGASKLTVLKSDSELRSVCPMTGAACPQPLKAWKQKTLLVGALVLALAWALVSIPISERALEGMGGRLFDFIAQLLPSSISEIGALPWTTLASSLLETVKIALLGTFFGALFSMPLAALVAGRTVPVALRTAVRTILNAMRAVPSLLWALLCTAVVGFGPLAGVIALSVYSIGYLSKFFYEALESIDRKPLDALRELGAGRMQRFLAGTWPLAKVQLLSSLFFVFEYNVRAASILGVVDAGGIGFYLKQFVEYRQFPAVLATLTLIVAVVLVLDNLSQQLRTRYAKQV